MIVVLGVWLTAQIKRTGKTIKMQQRMSTYTWHATYQSTILSPFHVHSKFDARVNISLFFVLCLYYLFWFKRRTSALHLSPSIKVTRFQCPWQGNGIISARVRFERNREHCALTTNRFRGERCVGFVWTMTTKNKQIIGRTEKNRCFPRREIVKRSTKDKWSSVKVSPVRKEVCDWMKCVEASGQHGR